MYVLRFMYFYFMPINWEEGLHVPTTGTYKEHIVVHENHFMVEEMLKTTMGTTYFVASYYIQWFNVNI